MPPARLLLLLLALCLCAEAGAQCAPPGMEDFDGATVGNPGVYPAGWTSAAATFPWSVGTGATPSLGTGPTGDHTTGTGNYLFCETSFPAVAGNTYSVQAPCFDATGVIAPTLEFSYHLFGPSIGTLAIWQFDGMNWVPIWCKTGDQGDVWKFASVPVVPVGGDVSVIIRYVVASDETGLIVYQGDAAVDDVSFGEPSSPQPPEFQENQPGLTVHINETFGDNNNPAVVNGNYFNCGGVVSPFHVLVKIEACVPISGQELAINAGNAIASSVNGLVLSDGQVINLDSFFSTVFLFGGLSPSFVPYVTPLIIPAQFDVDVNLTLQGFSLNPAAPLGLTFSAANELHIAEQVGGLPSVPGPQMDEAAVTVDVTTGSTCWAAGLPFFGTVYTQIHVLDNGRIRFDSATSDFTPSATEAGNSSMIGMWTDLDTGTGGGSTIGNPAPGIVRVDYLGVNYYGQNNTTVTFHIEMDTLTGVLTIGGLVGVEQLQGASQDTFLGLSPGGGALDPGSTPFLVGATGGPFTATDMIYELSPALLVPAFTLSGGDHIEFTPATGGYSWAAF